MGLRIYGRKRKGSNQGGRLLLSASYLFIGKEAEDQLPKHIDLEVKEPA